MCIKWCGENGVNRLFTGGCDNEIHAYKQEKNLQAQKDEFRHIGKTDNDNQKKDSTNEVKHEETIMDILPIADMGIIATASLDSNICLWSMETLQGKMTLRDHQKQVHSLEWYPEHRVILSAGTEHDIYGWNPTVNEKIFNLKGHNHSLVGVKWLKGTNQIISADISGLFKIWDVRTWNPVQSFNCPLNEINCFAVTSPPKRIVAGGRKLIFYDYDEPTTNHLADEQAALFVLYNPIFYTFITAHPKCIKIWDATTGAL